MYKDELLTPQEILPKLGIDYQSLGRKRTQGLVHNLRKKFERETEAERKAGPRKRPEFITAERRVQQLSAEVEYLRQENEFLKKIVSAGKEVRRREYLRAGNSG